MKAIIWILIIAAVAVGGYSVATHKKDAPAQVATEQETQQSEQPAASGKKVPFSTFIKQGNGSYQCTVHQYLSDVDNSGTVYINAGKIRGDFSTVAEGKTMEGSFLMDNGYQYLWMKGSTTGFKLPITSTTSGSVSAGASGTYSWNADQIGEYDCQPWVATASTFALPAGIRFTDMSSFKAR